jgi:autotransporter-associated beta strand protein
MNRSSWKDRRTHSAIIGAVLLTAVPALAAIPQYRVVDLSVGGTVFRGTAISPDGTYITTMGNPPGTTGRGGFLLNGLNPPGATLPFASPSTGTYTTPSAVNNLGQVAGQIGTGLGNPFSGTPTLWSNGVAYSLPFPPGYSGSGTSNSGGQVFGLTDDGQVSGSIGSGTPRGIIWHTAIDSNTGIPYVQYYELLGLLPVTGAQISDTYASANGWFTGNALNSSNLNTLGFVRDQFGQYYENIGAGYKNTLPFAINNNGVAVGGVSPNIGGGSYQTFRWDPVNGLSIVPMVKPGNDSSARGVNDSGLMVGTDNNAAVTGNISTGFISDGSSTFYLNDLIGPQGSSWDLQAPFKISNTGVVVGQGYNGLPFSGYLAWAAVPVAGTGSTRWTGTGSGNWSASTWTDGAADSNTYLAVFSQSISAKSTVTLDSNRTVQGITLNSTYGYVIASAPGATLRFESGTSDNATINVPLGNHEISANTYLASQTDISVRAQFTLTYSGNIAGVGSPNIAGPGVVIFTGTSTYTAPTLVSGGTFRGQDGVAIPSTSVLTLLGGVYELSGTFTRSLGTSGNNKVSFPAGATGGLSAYGGPLTVNIGGNATPSTLAVGDPAFSPSGLTLNGLNANAPLTFLNPIQLGGVPLTINVLSPTQPVTMAGAITGVGDLTKGGVGTLIFSNPANSYVGTMTIAGGTLQLANGAGLTGGVRIKSGATFDPTASSSPFVIAPVQTITLEPGGQVIGALAGSGTVAYTGGNQSPTTLVGGSNSLLIQSGTVTLNSTNTYTGPTVLTGGVLRAAQGGGLPTASLLTLSGGVYELAGTFSRSLGTASGQVQLPGGASGFSAFGGPLTVQIGGVANTPLTWGSAAFNPSSLVLNTSSADSALTFTNPVNLGSSDRTITVGANTATLTGIVSGNGGLVVTGPGVLSLTAANTYSGPTTITGGTLRAPGGVGLPAASNLVLNGGVYESSGTFTRSLGNGAGQVQVLGGGFSAVGSPLTVTLGAGNPALTWGSTYFNPGTLTFNGSAANAAVTLTNPVTLPSGNAVIQVNSNVATFSGVLSGSPAALIKSGPGVLSLSATNTFSATTLVTGGALRAADGINFPTSNNLQLSGGVFETSGTFNRTLGTGPGQVTLQGYSGFSAFGAPLTVTIGSGSSLDWTSDTTTFNPSTLVLNAASANAPITLTNALNVSSTTSAPRSITVETGTATLTGDVTAGNATVFYKYGAGRLVMNNATSFQGVVRIAGGTFALGPGVNFAGRTILLDSNAAFDPRSVSNPWTPTSASITFFGTGSTILGGVGGFTSLTFNNGSNTVLAGNLSGNVTVKVNNNAIATLAGTNTQSGQMTVSGGILRGNLSINSLLYITSGVYEGSGVFNNYIGSDPQCIQFASDGTSQGISAYGGPLTVRLDDDPTSSLTWGGSFLSIGTLILNNVTADSPLTLVNPLNLNAAVTTTRTLNVGANTATVTGKVSGAATFAKIGAGTLVLSNATNSNTGPILVSAGTLSLGTTGKIPSVPSITVSGTGTFDVSSVAGGYTIPVTQTLVATGGGQLKGTFNILPASTYTNANSTAGPASLNIGDGVTTATGTLTFTGTLAHTGATNIRANNAYVIFKAPAALGSSPLSITGNGAKLLLDTTGYASSNGYSAAGTFASISLGSSSQTGISTLAMTSTPRSTNSAPGVNPSVLVTSSISIAQNGAALKGFLDVGNNDVIIKGGSASLSTIRSWVAAWLATGNTGIGSSSLTPASAPFTTLAVIVNSAGGTPYFSSFDGVQNLTTSDVIIKATYVGDLNLDGTLDGRDYKSMLESAILGASAGLSGWTAGDVNYSGGSADITDLTAFISAYNYVSTTSGLPNFGSGQDVSGDPTSAIPEPSAVSLLAVPAMLASRRRRLR